MKIFVGNLSFDAKEPDVKRVFEGFGAVSSVVIKMKDHKAKSRGFGFVEMPDTTQAQAAIAGLSGKEFMGRPLKVDPARVETDADRKRSGRVSAHPDEANKPDGYQRRKTREKKPWHGSKPWEKRPSSSARGGKNRSWQKRDGEAKPWKGHSTGSAPRKKTAGESKSWQKSSGESKPWTKAVGESKPWKKRKPGAKPWEKPRRSPGGEWKSRKNSSGIKKIAKTR